MPFSFARSPQGCDRIQDCLTRKLVPKRKPVVVLDQDTTRQTLVGCLDLIRQHGCQKPRLDAGADHGRCDKCGGTGRISRDEGRTDFEGECPTCRGTGEISESEFAEIERDILARISEIKGSKPGAFSMSPRDKIKGVEIETYKEEGKS